MRHIILVAIAFAAMAALATQSTADTIDFSGVSNDTAVTNQYPGVVFSLEGGPDSSGSPTTCNGGSGEALDNSVNGCIDTINGLAYPTANTLDIAFTTPVDDVSFTFNNYGNDDPTPSTFSAYDSSDDLLASGDLPGDLVFSLVNVNGSGISDLQIYNGQNSSTSWLFAVQTLNFTPEGSPVPEPGTVGLFLSGLSGVGLLARMKRLGQTPRIRKS